MKVYGAISSSHAEDAPLLHNTQDEKKPPLFKGALATSSRKTIALAVAGVAACGAVAIVANTGSAPAFGHVHKLGDALEDAKAGKKDFCSNLISLSCEKDSIRFERVGCRRHHISSFVHYYVANTSVIAASLSIRKHHYFRVSTTLGGDV